MSAAWIAAGEGALLVALTAACAVAWRVDMRRMIIPDSVNLVVLASGLANAWLLAGAPTSGGFEAVVPVDACASATLFGLTFWGLRAVFTRAFGQEALGLGDVKLAFGVGAWIAAPYLLLYLLLTSAAAMFTYIAITWGRLFRPLHGRADAPAGAGPVRRAGVWLAKRVRPPRAFPYGPAMALGLVVVVVLDKAGMLHGLMGLGVVWSILG